MMVTDKKHLEFDFGIFMLPKSSKYIFFDSQAVPIGDANS